MVKRDDPILALILRFVGIDPQKSSLNQEFIQKEVHELNEYIQKFPENERESHAIEWVSKYAAPYRDAWEKKVVTEQFSKEHCADCPLLNTLGHKSCHIHDQWVELLTRYADNEITSQAYVKATLELLAKNKENLKIHAG